MINTYTITKEQYAGLKPIEDNSFISYAEQYPVGLNLRVEKTAHFPNLLSIPPNTTIIAGNIDLPSLKEIPEGVVLVSQTNIFLESVTKIHPSVKIISGGSILLTKLTEIPEGLELKCGYVLDLRNIIKVPKHFNPVVGGRIHLFRKRTIPNNFKPKCAEIIYSGRNKSKTMEKPNIIQWDNSDYIIVDSVLSQLVRRIGNVMVVRDIVLPDIISYVVTNGNGIYAHGDSIQTAKLALKYKLGFRFNSQFKDMSLDTSLNFDDAIECYHSITGACYNGISQFIKTVKRKRYTIQEIINITEGAHGHETFKNFFVKI